MDESKKSADEAKFEEWLRESIGKMATIVQTLKEAGFDPLDSVAEQHALYDKGLKPFYFFQKDGENGVAQTAVDGSKRVAVSINDGPDFRNDANAKTYTFAKDFGKNGLGLTFDKASYTWGGTLPFSLANSLQAKYPKLKVTVG